MHPNTEDLWKRHLSFEPEEARMLGLPAEGRKSLARLEEQIRFYRNAQDDPSVSVGLKRLARLAVHRFDRGEEHTNLERIVLAGAPEMTDAEGFLGEHADLLVSGLDHGFVAPVEVVRHFDSHELPALAARGGSAARLAEVVRSQVLPAAERRGQGRWRLGEEVYRWRMENMGLTSTPAVLVERAKAVLADLPTERASPDHRLQAGEVLPAYRTANERCVAFLRERGWFDLPADLEVPLAPVLPEMVAVTHAGNVPAPLYGQGGGAFQVLDAPDRHRAAWVAPLAVHEGVPGHYLQSLHWQTRFRAAGSAPDFVSFADVSAADRQDWGAMPCIEGWAVYAEDLMLRAGFHVPEQAAAVHTFHALRCVRAWLDIGLHCHGMELDDALAVLREHVGLDDADGRRELLRCMRAPTQPLTYFAGWQYLADWIEASGLPLAEAHAAILDSGPVLPIGAR